MDFNQTFEDFQFVYGEVIDKITELRETAETIREKMDSIISSCEEIEGEL